MDGERRGWRRVNDDDCFMGQAFFFFMVKTTKANDRSKAKGDKKSVLGQEVSKGSEGATETTVGKALFNICCFI